MRRLARYITAVALLVIATAMALDDWVKRTELPDLNLETAVTVLDKNGDCCGLSR